MDHGLQLVGTFLALGPVTRGNGSAVAGMFRIDVNIATAGSERVFKRDAVYFDTDQDTGIESAIAAQVRTLDLKEGEEVAVKVAAKASESNSKFYVNFTALSVERLAAPKASR